MTLTRRKACKDVDYVGLVFYQKSSRFVTAFQAKEISKFFQKIQKSWPFC